MSAPLSKLVENNYPVWKISATEALQPTHWLCTGDGQLFVRVEMLDEARALFPGAEVVPPRGYETHP